MSELVIEKSVERSSKNLNHRKKKTLLGNISDQHKCNEGLGREDVSRLPLWTILIPYPNESWDQTVGDVNFFIKATYFHSSYIW